MTLTPITQYEWDVSDIPIIGGHYAKIGKIIDLYATPCQPTGIIWVQAFFTGIPTLFISLVKPEFIDISARHSRRRNKPGRKFRFRAADIFRDAIVEIPVPRWVPFVIYEWTQRIGWYFLVADATEDFAINWMTTAYLWEGCRTPQDAYCYAEGGPTLAHIPASGIVNYSTWQTKAVHNVNQTGVWHQPITGTDYHCATQVSASPHPVFKPPGSLGGIELINFDTGLPLASGTAGDSYDGRREASASKAVLKRSGFPRIAVRMTGTTGYILLHPERNFFSTIVGAVQGINPDP